MYVHTFLNRLEKAVSKMYGWGEGSHFRAQSGKLDDAHKHALYISNIIIPACFQLELGPLGADIPMLIVGHMWCVPVDKKGQQWLRLSRPDTAPDLIPPLTTGMQNCKWIPSEVPDIA